MLLLSIIGFVTVPVLLSVYVLAFLFPDEVSHDKD